MSEEKNYEDIIFTGRHKDLKEEHELDKALDRAYQLLQFEIQLYWKRSLYFAGFISAIFIGYYNVLEKDIFLSTLLAIVGFSLSFAWFLATKGSKFWQENYEEHVYALERLAGRNILKNHFPEEPSCCVLSAKRFSVSKLNTASVLIIAITWFLLLFRPFFCFIDYCSVILICILIAVLLICCTQNKEESQLKKNK